MAAQASKIYATCMEEVLRRLDTAADIVADIERNGEDGPYMTELLFLQLRKSLELIAFSSLSANHNAYARVRADFENEWNAKRLLARLEKANEYFYPCPLKPPTPAPGGTKHFDRLSTGFMTKPQFVRLYDACSTILHARNPFQLKNPVTNLGFSVNQWIIRIRTLLKLHCIQMLGGEDIWLVEAAEAGKVHVYETTAVPLVGVIRRT